MTVPGFIVRNAFRNKRRVLLTVLSVAISLFLLTLLLTVLRIFNNPPSTAESALRLIVRHRVSLANVLPAKYQYRIERMPGVQYCSKFTWFGGIYRDEASSNFAQFAVEADRIFRIFPEAVVSPQEETAFVREKTACIVGRMLMERFGWKVGDKVTLQGALWPCDLELTIRGVYTGGGGDETILFFHHSYFDELMDNRGITGTFWLRVRDAEIMPELSAHIDTAFRNTNAETITETERAFQLNMISMIGNVKLFVSAIASVIVFTMVLVTANTMSMAMRERTREIAVLKALGFSGLDVFGLVLAESCGLALAGGVLGCLGARVLADTLDVYKLSKGNLPFFPITWDVITAGLVVALLLGVVSSLAPAWKSVRLTVTEGLRETE